MAAHDPAHHRQSQRSGRQRGCWIYVTADELRAVGLDPSEPPPAYHVWGGRNGGLMLRLYGSRAKRH